jgi:quercetin dioxygenase-like cupin family protein
MLLKIGDAPVAATEPHAPRRRVLVAPSAGNTRYLSITHLSADGGLNVPHWPIKAEQIQYTISGSATYTIDGTQLNAEAGTAVALPSNTTVALTVGADGWEALATTCCECPYWQNAATPGLTAVRSLTFEDTTANVGPIRRRGYFSPVLNNSKYLTLFHTQHVGQAVGPEHVHEVHEEALFISGGSFVLTVDGQDERAEPGSLLLVPPAKRVAHTAGAGGCQGVAMSCEACPLGGPSYGPEDIRQLLQESNPTLHFPRH